MSAAGRGDGRVPAAAPVWFSRWLLTVASTTGASTRRRGGAGIRRDGERNAASPPGGPGGMVPAGPSIHAHGGRR